MTATPHDARIDRRPRSGPGAAALGLLACLLALARSAAAAGLPPDPPRHSQAAGQPPTIESVEVVGLHLIDPPVRLADPLPLRRGQPYTVQRREAAREIVARAFAERGRPYADVRFREEADPERGTIAIRIEVTDPGPPVHFGLVQVEAIPPLTEQMVRERLAYGPGEPFRPSALEETRERLLMTPAVERALVSPLGFARGDTVATTVVSVAPVPRLRGPELEGTISSARCLEIAGFWRDRFFLGRPRVFSLGAGASHIFASQLENRFPCAGSGEGPYGKPAYFVEGELRHPWPGRPMTSVGVRGFARRESRPQAYVLQGAGGAVEVQRLLRRDLLAGVSYALQRAEVRAAGFYFCVVFDACTVAELDALAGPRTLAPVEGWLSWMPPRTRTGLTSLPQRPPGPLLVPRWRPWVRIGTSASSRLALADQSYLRLELEAGTVRETGRRTEVAMRGRAGALVLGDAPVPPHARFFSGGVTTVRGVQENLLGARVLSTDPAGAAEMGCTLVPGGCPPGTTADPRLASLRPQGGDVLLEANLEGRLRASDRVQLATFLDYGILRSERPPVGGQPPGRGWTSTLTPGAGLRVDSPVGFVRLDVGWRRTAARTLPLLTEAPEGTPGATAGDLLFLGPVVWDPVGRGDPGSLRRLFRRLHLGLAVGQPF